ncbi:MAG: Holliday junction branch migration protein RuvA [SAR324 cluster bacterium]|nr:Holliday junction branch migration protein RuvA [SAR324 cluster bacterium]
MIGYVEGKWIAELTNSVIVLTAGGIGYQLNLPAPLLARRPAAEEPARYFVVTVVRDNEISLYGFDQLENKTLFELLLKVSGIGPKVALSLLSAFSSAEIVTAVAGDDVALLGSISGIGKKTATRLCLDLKDRLANWEVGSDRRSAHHDVISALTNLGFPEKEIFAAVRQVSTDHLSFSDQLKKALALLAK